jgi:hypothetical protein
MTALVWDQVGDRIYQTGIDHGVLYLQDGTAIPWNGLISMDESSNAELKSFYLDGVKFLENLSAGDFIGKLKAFTYPEEFDALTGLVDVSPGMTLHEQPPKSFNLSYRTKIGDDIEGLEHGYEIHILYNLLANPESMGFNTLSDSADSPVEFTWTLTGTPPKINNFRPTVHISINSLTSPAEVLALVEAKLYGTATTGPSLPSIQDIAEIFGYLGALIIIDHGDGSWSALDESDDYITMLDATSFQIDNVDATYSDSVTYDVSSTNVDGGVF